MKTIGSLKYLLTVSILFCFLNINAQPAKVERTLTYNHYGIREGLGQTQNFYSFQDSWGYLWFVNNLGISRFDGKSFTNYTAGKELKNTSRIYFMEQIGSVIYMLSSDGITCYYPEGRFEFFPFPENLKMRRQVHTRKGNRIYVFNSTPELKVDDFADGHYFIFDLNKHSYTKSPEMLPFIKAVFQSGNNILLLSNNNRVFPLQKGAKHTVQALPPGEDDVFSYVNPHLTIRAVISKDKLYHDVYLLETVGDSIRQAHLATKKYFHKLIPLAKGKYLISYLTGSESSIIDNETETRLQIDITIPNHAITDREGNLWISSEEGIYNCHRLLFESYKLNISRNDNIWSVASDIYGNTWYGSYGYGFWRAKPDGSLEKAKAYNQGKAIDAKHAYMGVCHDAKNRLYMSYSEGVMIFDPAKGNINRLDAIKSGVSFIAFYDSLTNTVFTSGIEGEDFSLVAIDSSLRKKTYTFNMGYIVCVARDGNGRLRVGTWHGEAWLDEEKRELVACKEKKPYNSVISMASDIYGNLWIATTKGLFVESRKGKLTLIDPETMAFTCNYMNRYLISGGITGELKLLDLKEYAEEGKTSITTYGYRQGFDMLECGQNGFFIDNQGYVWINGPGKVIRFSPGLLMPANNPGIEKPYINFIESLNRKQELYPVNDKALPYENNSLRFSWLQASQSYAEQLVFRYRLTGYSNTWSEPQQERSALFSNLPHGKYVFELQSSLDGINWSDTAYSKEITINPPFWFTWWFIGLCIVLLVSIFTLSLLLLRKQMQKKQEEQQKIDQLRLRSIRSKHIPHFTGNVLSAINYLVLADKEEVNEYISEFSDFSQQTLLYAEKVSRTLSDEIAYTSLYLKLEKLRFGDKLNYTIVSDENVDNSIQIPALSIYTFCENAMKHGLRHKEGAGFIKVHISKENNYTIIAVEDNGIGRENARKRKTEGSGEGLNILNQQLSVYNKKNKAKAYIKVTDLAEGTIFELYIPDNYSFIK